MWLREAVHRRAHGVSPGRSSGQRRHEKRGTSPLASAPGEGRASARALTRSAAQRKQHELGVTSIPCGAGQPARDGVHVSGRSWREPPRWLGSQRGARTFRRRTLCPRTQSLEDRWAIGSSNACGARPVRLASARGSCVSGAAACRSRAHPGAPETGELRGPFRYTGPPVIVPGSMGDTSHVLSRGWATMPCSRARAYGAASGRTQLRRRETT